MENFSFFCPSPLAYASKNESGYVVWVYEGGDCAMKCPSLIYTDEEWNYYIHILIIVGLVTVGVASGALVLTIRQYDTYFPKIMFFCGVILDAFVLTVFLLVNGRNNSVVCNDDAHFSRQNNFCVFQAGATIFSIIQIESWGVVIAFDTYVNIVYNITKERRAVFYQRYIIITTLVSLAFVACPYIADNLGFDESGSYPMCLYLYTENSDYFWGTLFAPFVILNVLCLLITCACVYRLHTVFVSSSQHVVRLRPSVVLSEVESEYRFCCEDVEGWEDTYSWIDDIVSRASSVFSPEERPSLAACDNIMLSENGPSLFSSHDESKRKNKAQKSAGSAHGTGKCVPYTDDDVQSSISYSTTASNSTPTRDVSRNPILRDSNGKVVSEVDDGITSMSPSTTSSATTVVMGAHNPSNTQSRPVTAIAQEEKKALEASAKLMAFKDIISNIAYYHGRHMIFIVTFCFSTYYVMHMILKFTKYDYDKYEDGTAEYIECLLTVQAICPVRTQEGVDRCAERCGDHPDVRAPINQVGHDILENAFVIIYS